MTSEGGTRKLTFWLKLLQTARRYQETCVSTEKREWLLLLLIIGILFLFRVISSREFKAGNGDATIHAAKKETVGLGLATPAECNLKSGKKFKANVYEGERNIGSLLHETSRKAPIPSPVVKNPIFRMDANRYIVPILEGGANNQLFEFREAVYVAIKLNRTLVIPRFFKHFTDSQEKTTHYIHPGHRVHLLAVCKLISCITLDAFQETCNGKLDAIVSTANRKFSITNARAVQAYLTMQVGRSDGDSSLVTQIRSSSPRKLRSDDIAESFKSQERCVAYFKPLFNILLPGYNKRGKKIHISTTEAIENHPISDEAKLIIEIIKHTQHPSYIRQIAIRFIESLTQDQPLVTVHWRFNKGDYKKRCKGMLLRKRKGPPGKVKFCTLALSMTATDIANSIEEKLLEISIRLKNISHSFIALNHIYIASPPSEASTVNTIRGILKNKKGWMVHSSDEIAQFLSTKYPMCKFLKPHINDIISTIEMEVSALHLVYKRPYNEDYSVGKWNVP